jgi:hypothetical protein
MALSGTTAARMFDGVKVRRISIFSTTPAAGASKSITLSWLSENGPAKVLTDTSSSAAYVACIVSKPPLESLCGYYSLYGVDESTLLFNMTLNTGDVVDIDATVILNNSVSGTSGGGATVTISGGTAGTIGSTTLDHSGSQQLAPIGWNNYT